MPIETNNLNRDLQGEKASVFCFVLHFIWMNVSRTNSVIKDVIKTWFKQTRPKRSLIGFKTKDETNLKPKEKEVKNKIGRF